MSNQNLWAHGAMAASLLLVTSGASAQPSVPGLEKSSVYWVPEGAPESVASAHTRSGAVLAFTNSDEQSVGFLGLDPVPGGGQPVEIATLQLGAVLPGAAQTEPPSVAATPDNRWFVIAMNTSIDAPEEGSGVAVVVDARLAAAGNPQVVATIPLPGQPDSVAASKRKSNYVAIAIENETDEDSGNNLAVGSLVVIQTKPRHKPAKWKATTVDLTGLNITSRRIRNPSMLTSITSTLPLLLDRRTTPLSSSISNPRRSGPYWTRALPIRSPIPSRKM